MNRFTFKEYYDLLSEANIVKEHDLGNDPDRTVHHVTFDSGDATYGTMFICKGVHFKAEYLADALSKGAFAYISETIYQDADAPYIIVDDMRTAMALIAGKFYNDVWQNIEMIGLTGTKGKSTTAYFLKYILDDHAKAVKDPETAILSSIDTYDGVARFESHLTTPEAIVLHDHISNAVKSGIKHLVMEVSSQALKYQRTQGILYDVGAFLNIGEDHISPIEHPTFEDYAESKLILADQSKVCVVNADSDIADDVIARAVRSESCRRIITFGIENDADVYGYDIRPGRKGIAFRARSEAFDEQFEIGLTGIFNVSNALAAISICYALNIPMSSIKAGLKKARVSGRMEVFSDEDGEITVIVDYAHNKMSMEALFESTRKEYPECRITIVFGCPGKKALGRRKVLGEIAGRYADMCYLTEEDPGEEDAHDISEEIAGHIAGQGGKFEIIDDRKEAIFKAIADAKQQKTVVLVTAKGRETRQKRGLEYIDVVSDVDLVREALREL